MHPTSLPKNPGGKTLVFNVTIIHYETADTTDHVFGPLEQVVAHAEIVDKQSGQVLATGNVIGRTGKTVGLGTWKARGLVRGLFKWVAAYHPKGKEAEEADQEKEKESESS
jgi:hypothetical protein